MNRLAVVIPITVLGVAAAWLVVLAVTTSPVVGLLLALVALATAVVLGGARPGGLIRSAGPLLGAAVGIALANVVLSPSNVDPGAVEIGRIGPLRLTQPALDVALGLGARVLAIVSIGVVFSVAVSPTRLADALVQQARVSPRFAYGALAAYGAVPRLATDLATLREMRRARGLRGSWHPRILVGLLVRAIRHADQLGLAMDARGFDVAPGIRTAFRPIRWGRRDLVFGGAGLAALALVVALTR